MTNEEIAAAAARRVAAQMFDYAGRKATILQAIEDAVKLTSPPAPSGWQQRIAAMPSGAAYVHVEIRDETSAVLDSFNVDAKGALPPAPEGSPAKDPEAAAVGMPTLAAMWPWAITSTGNEYCFFCKAWRHEKQHAHNCIWQAAQLEADASPVKDPIAAAVNAQLDPLKDELTAIGHKLAKETK